MRWPVPRPWHLTQPGGQASHPHEPSALCSREARDPELVQLGVKGLADDRDGEALDAQRGKVPAPGVCPEKFGS